MALRGSARLCAALGGSGRLWVALGGSARLCAALGGSGWLWEALRGSARLCAALGGSGWLCAALRGAAWRCVAWRCVALRGAVRFARDRSSRVDTPPAPSRLDFSPCLQVCFRSSILTLLAPFFKPSSSVAVLPIDLCVSPRSNTPAPICSSVRPSVSSSALSGTPSIFMPTILVVPCAGRIGAA